MQSCSKGMNPGMMVTYEFEKAILKEPAAIEKPKPGLHYDYYERFFVSAEDLDLVDPVSSGTVSDFNISTFKRENYFGFKYSGYIRVPKDGIYTFYLKSNDGSRLYIDDEELIENDGNHGAIEEPGSIGLKADLHKIVVKYFQCGGGKTLQVSWAGPGFEKRAVRAQELFIDN
jgi:hypothetical protein